MLLFACGAGVGVVYSSLATLSTDEIDQLGELTDLSQIRYPYMGLGEKWLAEQLATAEVTA